MAEMREDSLMFVWCVCENIVWRTGSWRGARAASLQPVPFIDRKKALILIHASRRLQRGKPGEPCGITAFRVRSSILGKARVSSALRVHVCIHTWSNLEGRAAKPFCSCTTEETFFKTDHRTVTPWVQQ